MPYNTVLARAITNAGYTVDTLSEEITESPKKIKRAVLRSENVSVRLLDKIRKALNKTPQELGFFL